MDEPPKKKKKSLIIILVLLLIIGITPFVMTSFFGKPLLRMYVRAKTGGEIQAKEINLSWFGSQRIEQATFKSRDGKLEFKAESVEIESSLLVLAFSKRRVSHAMFVYSGELPILQHMNIHEGELRLFQNGKASVEFSQLEVDILIPSAPQALSFSLRGQSEENGIKGNFMANMEMSFRITGESNLELQNFPIQGLEDLLVMAKPELKGKLVSALGRTAEAQFHCTMQVNNVDADFRITTPLLEGFCGLMIENEELYLKESSNWFWKITPEFLPRLKSPANLELLINTINIPLKERDFQLALLETDVQLNLSGADWKAPEALTTSNSSLTLNTKNLQEKTLVTLTTDLQYGNAPRSKFVYDASWSDWFDLREIQYDRLLETFRATLTPLSSTALSALFPFNANTWLGNSIAFDIQSQNRNITLNLKSPKLTLDNVQFELNHALALKSKTELSYVLPKEYGSSKLDLSLRDFSWDFSNWKTSSLDLSLTADQYQEFQNIEMDIQGKTLENLHFKGEAKLKEPILESPLLMQVDGTANLANKQLPNITIQLQGDELKAKLQGSVQNQVFSLTKPLVGTLQLKPEKVNATLLKESEIKLKEPAEMSLEVKNLSFKVEKNPLSSLILDARGTLPEAQMLLGKGRGGFPLQKLELKTTIHAPKTNFDTLFTGEAAAGSFSLRVTSDDFDLETPREAIFDMRLKCDDFSSQVVDSLFKMEGSLDKLIGSSFDLTIDLDNRISSLDLDIDFRSPHLTFDATFGNHEQLTLKKPASFSWTISQEALDFLQGKRSVILLKPATITGELKKLNLPIKQKHPYPHVGGNLNQVELDGSLKLNQLDFNNLNQESLGRLHKLSAYLRKRKNQQPLHFELNTNLAATEMGVLSAAGQIDQYLSPQGSIDFSKLNTHIEMQGKSLPTRPLDAILHILTPRAPYLAPYFGNQLNIAFETQLENFSGPLTFSLDSSKADASLKGTVVDGTLLLDRPFTAQMRITKELGDALFKDMKVTIAKASQDLRIRVDSSDFEFPLKDYNVRKIRIGNGQIALGEVWCLNHGAIADVNKLFRNSSKENEISIWFAPGQFAFENGKFYLQRLEILFDRRLDLALWGNISFAKSFVNMILGLTDQSLYAGLGISGLPKDYVLQVPLKGPFGKVKLDVKSATAKITAILAKREVLSQLGGAWGGLLNALGSALDNQSNVPPPKKPFPWEGQVKLKYPPAQRKNGGKNPFRGLF